MVTLVIATSFTGARRSRASYGTQGKTNSEHTKLTGWRCLTCSSCLSPVAFGGWTRGIRSVAVFTFALQLLIVPPHTLISCSRQQNLDNNRPSASYGNNHETGKKWTYGRCCSPPHAHHAAYFAHTPDNVSKQDRQSHIHMMICVDCDTRKLSGLNLNREIQGCFSTLCVCALAYYLFAVALCRAAAF